MNIKKLLPLFFVPLIVGTLVLIAGCLFGDASAGLDPLRPYFDAPRLGPGEDPAAREGEIVWLKGKIVSAAGVEPLRAPLSERRCWHYRYEKWLGSWETDSDGDSSRVWTTVDGETRSLDLALAAAGRTLPFDPARALFYDLPRSADDYRVIDGSEYRLVENIIPLENEAWAAGKIERGRLTPGEREVMVTLLSPESVARALKGDFSLDVYFGVLVSLAAAGVLAGWTAWLLRDRRGFPRPGTVALAAGAALYFWAFSGGVFLSLSESSPLPGLIVSLMTGGFFLPFFSFGFRRFRLKPLAIVLITLAGAALAAAAAWFLDLAFYTLGSFLPPLAAGVGLFAGGVVLFLFLRSRLAAPA